MSVHLCLTLKNLAWDCWSFVLPQSNFLKEKKNLNISSEAKEGRKKGKRKKEKERRKEKGKKEGRKEGTEGGRDGATGGELRSRDRQVCGARRGVCPWFGGGLGAERQYVGRDEAAVLGTVGRKEVRNNTTIIAAREARFQPRRGTEFCLTQRVCFKSFLRAKRCGRHGMNQTLSLTFKR